MSGAIMQIYYVVLSIVAGILRGPALLYSLINGTATWLASKIIALPFQFIRYMLQTEWGRYLFRFLGRFLENMGALGGFAVIAAIAGIAMSPLVLAKFAPYYRAQTTVIMVPALHINALAVEGMVRGALLFDGEFRGVPESAKYVKLDLPFPYWYRTDKPLGSIGLGPVFDSNAKSGFVLDNSTWDQSAQNAKSERLKARDWDDRRSKQTDVLNAMKEDYKWWCIIGWILLMATSLGTVMTAIYWRLMDFVRLE